MNRPIAFLRRFLYCLLALSCTSGASAQIEAIGIAGDSKFTRIVFTTQQAITPEIALKTGETGHVLAVTMPGYTLKAEAALGEPMGAISAYTLHRDRIVFELGNQMIVARQFALQPGKQARSWRLIVDLQAAPSAPFDQREQHNALPTQSQANPVQTATTLNPSATEGMEKHQRAGAEITRIGTPSRKPERLRTVAKSAHPHVVIIDAGHGGRDPGAIAAAGYRESGIVLDTALILKALMANDPRYDVRLTRESDVYVEHEDRITKARNWGADLFISIHADAAARPSVAGASVYTISTRGEARIEGTARKYGWELPLEDGTPEAVSDILQDLTVRETKSNSVIFAEILVPELGRAGPLLRNTHRRKNLFVLLAPDVPAVLIEIGFLTNSADARRLNSRNGREKTAQAIKRAIDAYFERQAKIQAQK